MHTYAQRRLKLLRMVAALLAMGLVVFGGSALARAVPASDRYSGRSDPVLHTGGDECCGCTVWCMRVTPGSHSTTAPTSKAATTRSATSSAACSRTLITTSKPKLGPPDEPGVPAQLSDRKDDTDHE